MNKLNLRLILAFLCIPFILLAQNGNLTQEKNGMVTTAHPLATEAALEILHLGGNAVDAAVAAAFAVGVVEPDGSGIGGGGGMVIYLKEKNKSFYINYYAQAPADVPEKFDSKVSRHTGLSIGIPGTVAGLTLAHKKFGTLPLSVILKPAIRYAENCFPIDATLSSLILDNNETLGLDSATATIYLEDAFPKMEGEILIQKDLAKTLRAISERGSDGFYKGEVAASMAEGIKKRNGRISVEDFANYEAVLTEPLKGTYRGYEVLSAANPQSGASIIQGLNMLELMDFETMGHYTKSANTAHMMAETFRKVYTDRDAFVGDPDYVKIPTDGIMSKEFARKRYQDIDPTAPVPVKYRDTEAGNPWDFQKHKKKKKKNSVAYLDLSDDQIENNHYEVEHNGETTHLSIIDKDGNAVSLTQTLGTFFGSAQTVNGVLFNCAISNFSSNDKSSNALGSNKQPRSSIAPTLILKDNKPFMIIGTPGGSRILATVLQVIVNVIDFDMNAEEANTEARIYCQKWVDYLHLESGVDAKVIDQLREMGHAVQVHQGKDLFFGGVHMVLVDPVTGEYSGSADVRRGGNATGY
jgi:gamma-glutamyltranspeptidase/glutathione hydrolase